MNLQICFYGDSVVHELSFLFSYTKTNVLTSKTAVNKE